MNVAMFTKISYLFYAVVIFMPFNILWLYYKYFIRAKYYTDVIGKVTRHEECGSIKITKNLYLGELRYRAIIEYKIDNTVYKIKKYSPIAESAGLLPDIGREIRLKVNPNNFKDAIIAEQSEYREVFTTRIIIFIVFTILAIIFMNIA